MNGKPAKRRCVLVAMLLAQAGVCAAGLRTEGAYSGTVIFDRWDSCTLYSGVYVMYLANAEKATLREHAGESVTLDATEVVQPRNPGDGVIRGFNGVRPAAPEAGKLWQPLEGLRLRAGAEFADRGGKPTVSVTVENRGRRGTRVHSSELAPTLLTTVGSLEHEGLMPGAGPSYALITRQAFVVGGDEPRTAGRGVAMGTPYAWRADQELPRNFVLLPGQSRTVRIEFDLPPGEYDFLAGYGGGVHAGRGLASNLVAFDVDEHGKAVRVSVKGRGPAASAAESKARGELTRTVERVASAVKPHLPTGWSVQTNNRVVTLEREHEVLWVPLFGRPPIGPDESEERYHERIGFRAPLAISLEFAPPIPPEECEQRLASLRRLREAANHGFRDKRLWSDNLRAQQEHRLPRFTSGGYAVFVHGGPTDALHDDSARREAKAILEELPILLHAYGPAN